MINPLFDDALKIDQLLYKLASYDVIDGYLIYPKNEQELIKVQDEVAKKFNHFKKLIQLGEMTLIEISDMVVAKSGPFLNKKNVDLEIEKLIEGEKTEPDLKPKSDFTNSYDIYGYPIQDNPLKSLLGLFKGFSGSQYGDNKNVEPQLDKKVEDSKVVKDVSGKEEAGESKKSGSVKKTRKQKNKGEKT